MSDEDDHDTDDGPEPPTTPYRTDEYRHEAPDGTELAITVFEPEAGDEFPVLLQRTPYGRPDEPDGLGVAAPAIDAGYAVAYEDTRGRGDSDGDFEPWVHAAEDGAATIEWLADRPWSDGSVGTYGGSSPGQVQLFAAAERPRGLEAIAPMFSPSDAHRADFFQDGAMSAMAYVTWSLGQSVAGHTVDRFHRQGIIDESTAEDAHEALDTALDDLEETVRDRPLVTLPDRVFADVDLPDDVSPGDLVPHWEEWTSRPVYDEFWRSFDPEPDYDRMSVPGLHVTGWYELCQSGTIRNFAGMRDRTSAPQHLVVGPWAHQDTSGEIGTLDFGDAASADDYGVWDTHLDFFDTYVRGDPTGAFDVDGGRLVDTVRTSVTADGGSSEWVTSEDWPPANAHPERWFLGSGGAASTSMDDGRLTRTPPEKFESPDRWTHDPTDPVPTNGGPLCCGDVDAGVYDQRDVERRDDVCVYTTDRLSEAVELAGPVRADLTVETDAPDTDITAKLVHVTDDGPAYNLCEGIRRARFRHGRDRLSPVPEGPFRVTIDMWDVHHRIPAGDRLRLEVASSNHPRFDVHPGTVDCWSTPDNDVGPAEQTLHHELDRESTVTVTRRF